MVTSPRPPASRQHRVLGPLAEALVTLAGTPDDASDIADLFVTVARLSADLVAPVSYASVTVIREGAGTTVAASSDLAAAVDRAQYADGSGPCLEALDVGAPVGVADVAATMNWPGFRDQAFRLGLRASLSIPLFAGSGVPVAVLNLYGHDPTGMAPLTSRVWAVYKPRHPGPDNEDREPLDPGGADLIAGLTGAFAVRAVVQRAIGVIMAGGNHTPDAAYLILRVRAAEVGVTLVRAATDILAEPA
ncbi:MAG TPA: GAF and ANTAR domain-containing protein [Catenuloplanes sp.]|jgi:hypothetical protein